MSARKNVKPDGRGGRRAGAGRPVEDDSGAKRPVTVWLTPDERAHLEQLGGTAQEGIRGLIRTSMGVR
jgi:hypothetical protein